ncbi:MAG: (4Fe-4S)-binding protein [Firmicutes bacterium ML8_F2]|nr:MAG: (4Fe-4S)-binding protein [Firmicutes bacterium ML8_F2]
MKKITVISGKGGTGKTSLVGSFAALASKNAVFVDADVDAANLNLIMHPQLLEEHEFTASQIASIELSECTQCGLCRDLCRFEAISEEYVVDPVACEGCGFCSYTCPVEAIKMEDRVSGKWFVSETPFGTLVHARLGIAEENSGKLVTAIRNRGAELAEAEEKDYLLIDGPPGIGCPVIASLSGVDAALIVTEPTVSGIHDLKRVLSVCRHFGITASVCVNRFDLDKEQTQAIDSFCRKEKINLAGKIPFDRVFVEAMVKGMPVVEYSDGPVSKSLRSVWESFIDGLN